MLHKKTDDDYEYLLERARRRLVSARSAYENACREKAEAEAYLNPYASCNLFREMEQLEKELQIALNKDASTNIRMVTTRRAISNFVRLKAALNTPPVFFAAIGLFSSLEVIT